MHTSALLARLPLGGLALLGLPLAVGVAVVHVLRVGARVREALAALVALVGLLARVQARVLDEVVLVFERLLTDLALVRTLACTHARTHTHTHTHTHKHMHTYGHTSASIDFHFRSYGSKIVQAY